MERELSYVLKLSLQEMALRRIVVLLWNGPDILASIAKLPVRSSVLDTRTWRETIECEVKDKISKLLLPESLLKKLMQTFKPIGLQILRWEVFHEDFGEIFDVPVLEKLYWTCTGTLDYRETAKAIVRSDVMNITNRYKLACLYCFEDCILDVWEELPDEAKGEFYKDVTPRLSNASFHIWWPYFLKGKYKLEYLSHNGACVLPLILYDDQRMIEYRKFALVRSASAGNKAATEYFFQKLTQAERDLSLVKTALLALRSQTISFRYSCYIRECATGNFSEVICYFLSLMTPEQQIHVFKEMPCKVLKCFMEWPWQDLFSDVADVAWTFLSEDQYSKLVHKICLDFEITRYYLPHLLRSLCSRSPAVFRKHVLKESKRYHYFIQEFFCNQDTEIIKLIFRNMDSEDRESSELVSLIYSLCKFCISEDKHWNMLEIFFGEVTLLEEDIKRLKYSFKSMPYPKWRRLDELLDKIAGNAESKRSFEGEELAEFKTHLRKRKK